MSEKSPKLFDRQWEHGDGRAADRKVIATEVTLRDLFAMAALAGYRAQHVHTILPAKSAAEWAYQDADAMLAARREGDGE